MSTPNEITCPSCGIECEPIRRRLPGMGSILRFGWFCPSLSCNSRVDHEVEKASRKNDEDETDENRKTEPAPPPVLSSMTAARPAKTTVPASPESLFDQIRRQHADARARVERLEAELGNARRDLAILDKMFELLPAETTAPIAAE